MFSNYWQLKSRTKRLITNTKVSNQMTFRLLKLPLDQEICCNYQNDAIQQILIHYSQSILCKISRYERQYKVSMSLKLSKSISFIYGSYTNLLLHPKIPNI